MALPFDILTQIALYAEHNTLLSMRGVCKELYEYVTPLALRSLRYPCTLDGFSRLHSLGLDYPSLSELVKEIYIHQSGDDLREVHLSQARSESLTKKALPALKALPQCFDNLSSITISFHEEVIVDGRIEITSEQIQNMLVAYVSPEMRLLHSLSVLNIAKNSGSLYISSRALEKLCSLHLTTSNQKLRLTVPLPFWLETFPTKFLPYLSPSILETLCLGSTGSISEPVAFPKSSHFLHLKSLTLRGFELDSDHEEASQVNLADFVICHLPSLNYLNTEYCAFQEADSRVRFRNKIKAWEAARS